MALSDAGVLYRHKPVAVVVQICKCEYHYELLADACCDPFFVISVQKC